MTSSIEKAAQFYTIAAEAGYPRANFTLGCMYQDGDGVTKDLKKALQFYTIAAEGNGVAKELLKSMRHCCALREILARDIGPYCNIRPYL